MSEAHDYLTFWVAGLHMGVPVPHVLEVVRGHEITAVPTSGSRVAGLMNLRGRILVVIDLLQRLSLRNNDSGPPETHIVTCATERPVSLLVHEAGDVVAIADADVRPPPPTFPVGLASAVRGVITVDQHQLLLLDVATVLRVCDVDASIQPKPRANHA